MTRISFISYGQWLYRFLYSIYKFLIVDKRVLIIDKVISLVSHRLYNKGVIMIWYDMIDFLKHSFILNYKHSMGLYNHLLVLANLLALTSFWGGATSSHLNSLGSIQGCCLIWHTHLVKPLAIITCLSLVLEELETCGWAWILWSTGGL